MRQSSRRRSGIWPPPTVTCGFGTVDKPTVFVSGAVGWFIRLLPAAGPFGTPPWSPGCSGICHDFFAAPSDGALPVRVGPPAIWTGGSAPTLPSHRLHRRGSIRGGSEPPTRATTPSARNGRGERQPRPHGGSSPAQTSATVQRQRPVTDGGGAAVPSCDRPHGDQGLMVDRRKIRGGTAQRVPTRPVRSMKPPGVKRARQGRPWSVQQHVPQ